MRKFKHGFLGKIKYYEEFKDVPPTTEERRKKLLEQMKPWEFDPRRPVFVGGKPGGGGTPPQQNYIWFGMKAHGTGETWRSEDNMTSYTSLSNVPVGAWAYTDYSAELNQVVVGRNYSTTYNTKSFLYTTDKGLTYTESNDTLAANERPRVGDYSPTLGAWMWKTYYNNQIANSTDGINWTEVFVSNSNQTDWHQWLPEYGVFHQQKHSTNFYYSEDLVSEVVGTETRKSGGGGYLGNYPGGILQNSQGEYFAIRHNRGDVATIFTTTNGKDWEYDGNIYGGYTFRCEPRAALVNGDGYLMFIPQIGTADGMYSADDGATWTPFNVVDNTTHASGFNIRRAILDPNGTTIYAACARNGIIKSTDGGFTWEDHFYDAAGFRSIIAIPE